MGPFCKMCIRFSAQLASADSSSGSNCTGLFVVC